jgi:peptidoglycan/LPS O-acetylase OafA/YrhL
MTELPIKADFRPDINALRALAVLGVVAYHYGLPGFGGGFAGVDVFFVISGFLIGGQIFAAHVRGNFSFQAFFSSRLRRIFPALALLVMVCLAWMWFHALPFDYLKSTRHAVAALFFLSNLAFTGEQGYFDLAAHAKPLLHTWSLSVEGQFYLFMPLVVAFAWCFARRFLPALLWLLSAFSLALSLSGGQSESANAFYLLAPRAWEFLAGCLLAWYATRLTRVAHSNALALISLLALLAAFTGLNAELVWPGYWTLLPVAAALGVMASGKAPRAQAVLCNGLLQRLGDVSYSLYLWHWPVLVFARQYFENRQITLTPGYLLGLCALSLVLALASWRWVEQPIRSQLTRWTRKRLWLAVLGVWLVAFAFGAFIVKNRGVPERVPSYVQRAAQAVFFDTPRDDCFRNPDSRKKRPETFCHFSAEPAAAPTLLLWGDSFANQYLAALADAAAGLGQDGLIATQGACRASVAGEVMPLPASIAQSCQNFNLEVHQLLAKTPSIRTVVLGLSWGGVASVQPTLDLVQQLLQKGKTVLLMGPVSQPGFDVPQRWATLQLQAGKAVDDWHLPAANYADIFALRTHLQAQLAQPIAQKNLVLIDPLSHLCDAQQCWLVRAGQANFRDTGHLSQTAAQAFTPDFAQALHTLGY